MKKRIAILCVLMLGISMLAACGNNTDQTAQDTENPEDSEKIIGEEDAPLETISDDGMTEAYEGIIDDYRSLVEEQWDYDQIYEHNYSNLATMVSVGYTLYDLDQDGQLELLIGETDTEEPGESDDSGCLYYGRRCGKAAVYQQGEKPILSGGR